MCSSDLGSAFRSLNWLKELNALNIRVAETARFHPAGRGRVERMVGTIKTLLRKMLATNATLSWDLLPFVISKVLNNTVSPKTKVKPVELVLGSDGVGKGFLDLDNFVPPPHFFVRSEAQQIKEKSKEIKELTDFVKNEIAMLNVKNTEKLNKNRVNKEFKIGDIVFLVAKNTVPGAPRVLQTKLSPSPWVVVRPLFTTTLLKRVVDGRVSL